MNTFQLTEEKPVSNTTVVQNKIKNKQQLQQKQQK